MRSSKSSSSALFWFSESPVSYDALGLQTNRDPYKPTNRAGLPKIAYNWVNQIVKLYRAATPLAGESRKRTILMIRSWCDQESNEHHLILNFHAPFGRSHGGERIPWPLQSRRNLPDVPFVVSRRSDLSAISNLKASGSQTN